MRNFDLTGRLAAVTGAAGGLGTAFATGLAEAGADIVAVDLPDAPGLEHTVAAVEEQGRRCHVHPIDLVEIERLPNFADQIHDDHGPVHILVNNAGVSSLQHFNEITVADWRRIMLVNLDAVFFLTQRFAEHMIRDGTAGRIINVSSKNGLIAEAGLAPYNASKGALELLTQSLATELGPHGITVNTIAPGMIKTPIADDFPLERHEFETAWIERIPLRGGYGSPEDCIGALLLLASDSGAYITGTHIVVDGGVLADQMPRLKFMPPLVIHQ